MHQYFRSLVLHQAKFHKVHLEAWGLQPSWERVEPLFDGLLYDGLWLTKFPLLFSPTYGVARLKAVETGLRIPGGDTDFLKTEILSLRPLVDADLLRFVLGLKPSDLEARVELFFGGRAMNKALWQYLAAWFEHGAVLRGRLGASPGLLETVFE